MKTYFVIARVNEIDYLTKVEAESESGAEHVVLKLAYTGKHTYGVTACQAFDCEMMKTECFRASAIASEPISFEALIEVIDKRNMEIEAKDRAEERIHEINKHMSLLQKELDSLKKDYNL